MNYKIKNGINHFKNYGGLALATSGVLCLSSFSSKPNSVANENISLSESKSFVDTYDYDKSNVSDRRTSMDKLNEFYGKKVKANQNRVTGLSSTDVITNTTSLSTTSTTNTTSISTNVSTVTTTEAEIPEYVIDFLEENYDQCSYMKSKYFYVDSFETYVISEEDDTLETICSNIGTPSIYDIWDFLPINLDTNDSFIYPIKNEYYVASKGERIEDIAFFNGIDESVIRKLNNIPDYVDSLDFNTNILLHTFKGNSTSYNTKKGVSNVFNNNKIFADKLVSVGDNGNEQVLGLLNDRFIYGSNSVCYYKFDGNGNYSSKTICSNVIDIDVVDGELAAYVRDDDYAYGMALNAGISNPDDFSISQFQTNFNYFYDISFDKFMEPYIKCSEGRQYVR